MKQDKYMLVNPPYKHVPQLLERCWPTNTKKAECTALAKVFFQCIHYSMNLKLIITLSIKIFLP